MEVNRYNRGSVVCGGYLFWCYRFQAGEVWVAPQQGVVMDEKMGRFDCVVDQADMVGRQTYEE